MPGDHRLVSDDHITTVFTENTFRATSDTVHSVLMRTGGNLPIGQICTHQPSRPFENNIRLADPTTSARTNLNRPARTRHNHSAHTLRAAHKCRYVRGGCGLRGVEIAGEVLESGVDSDCYDCVSGAKLARNVDRTDDVESGGCPRE